MKSCLFKNLKTLSSCLYLNKSYSCSTQTLKSDHFWVNLTSGPHEHWKVVFIWENLTPGPHEHWKVVFIWVNLTPGPHEHWKVVFIWENLTPGLHEHWEVVFIWVNLTSGPIEHWVECWGRWRWRDICSCWLLDSWTTAINK